MCASCLLKDDMTIVSYMIEVNDYIEKSGLFFQKAKKNGSNEINLEITEK